MKPPKYTLDKISYSRKEDCRIMESILNHWFKDPKELNFFSPFLLYPFNFKKFIQNYNDNTNTLILKHEDWIIGHISSQLGNENLSIFHLFIEPGYRKMGFAKMLLAEIEKISKNKSLKSISVKIAPKNMMAMILFKKLSYKIKTDSTSKSLKLQKII